MFRGAAEKENFLKTLKEKGMNNDKATGRSIVKICIEVLFKMQLHIICFSEILYNLYFILFNFFVVII